MTAEQKAKELVSKFKDIKDAYYIDELAKERALIAVDEMIEYENRMLEEWTIYFEGKGGQMKIERLFWEEVKHEIKKL